jgi:hypothetical protein
MNFRAEIAFAPLQLASRFNAKFLGNFSGEKTPPNATPSSWKKFVDRLACISPFK